MAPRSLKFAAIVGITALSAVLPAAALAGGIPVGDTSAAPPAAATTDTGSSTVAAPVTPDTSGTPSTDQYNAGTSVPPATTTDTPPKTDTAPPTTTDTPPKSDPSSTNGGGCDSAVASCTPNTPPCTVNCTPSTGCVTDCPKDDCAVIGGGQAAATSCSAGDTPPKAVAGGGGTPSNVAGRSSDPVAGGGGQLPFTGLPIAWVIALGLAMVLGGVSFIYRAQWKAKLAARRTGH